MSIKGSEILFEHHRYFIKFKAKNIYIENKNTPCDSKFL